MGKFIKTTVRYDKIQPDGTVKAVKEKCLIDAMTITEAESRALAYYEDLGGNADVIEAKKSNVSEVILDGEGERFFDVNLKFIALDEKTGKEKKQLVIYLFQADTLDDARKKITEHMKGSVTDYIISSVSESAISEYID